MSAPPPKSPRKTERSQAFNPQANPRPWRRTTCLPQGFRVDREFLHLNTARIAADPSADPEFPPVIRGRPAMSGPGGVRRDAAQRPLRTAGAGKRAPGPDLAAPHAATGAMWLQCKRWNGRPLRTASRRARDNARRAARENSEESVHGTGCHHRHRHTSTRRFQLHGATAEGEPSSPCEPDHGLRRRRGRDSEKAGIIVEGFVPGASLNAVAMRHGVDASTLSSWRGQALRGEPGPVPRVPAVPAVVPVVVGEDAAPRHPRRSRLQMPAAVRHSGAGLSPRRSKSSRRASRPAGSRRCSRIWTGAASLRGGVRGQSRESS